MDAWMLETGRSGNPEYKRIGSCQMLVCLLSLNLNYNITETEELKTRSLYLQRAPSKVGSLLATVCLLHYLSFTCVTCQFQLLSKYLKHCYICCPAATNI